MNILFFSRLFYPHIGGVEKHILEISKILIKKGHKVTVVAEQHASNLKTKDIVAGINVLRIPNLDQGKLKKFKIWTWLSANISIIRNADVVHCHDVFFWYLPFRFLFPFKKVFTTFHGYEGYPLRHKDILMHKISEKLSMENICIGDFIKKWYGTKPTYVSYGAVDFSEIKNQKSKIKNKESAVFIGRLDELNGILIYDEAVRIIREKMPNFKFLVIGEGSLRSKINNKVKILNPLSNAVEYFNDYNFAFVTGYLSMFEAMAARKMVFAVYDNPIKEDYLKMSPFSKYIIVSNSSSELAEKLIYHLKYANEANENIDQAYHWAKGNTWEKMTEKYLELWDKNL